MVQSKRPFFLPIERNTTGHESPAIGAGRFITGEPSVKEAHRLELASRELHNRFDVKSLGEQIDQRDALNSISAHRG